MAHRAPVVIAPYNDQWPVRFHEESEALASVLPRHFVIENIGSTAVPGMPAKPVIDMLLGADSLADIELVIPALARLGYEYIARHEAEIPDRRFLAKPVVRPRHFHLHGVVMGGTIWREQLRFRDLLRSDAALAGRYAALKQHLAGVFGDDRAGYTDAKRDFIHAAVRGTIANGLE
ncbi:GrpB family protein [Luteimonas sp. MC1782]|uniref:GrpB family protein n=1 Tax=Luteimonas sp. MC1782 TaxID=2760305 RepID=UPI0016026832|nr:GrpB family protein [Luteimonas sp. MC1782]MBB1473064.1 GrpB family protein [Luteimonas sp. MC1782]